MLFESLFLALTLGSESAERKTAEIKAKQMINDTNTMGKEYFERSRRQLKDKFMLFGKVGDDHCNKSFHFQWHEALEKLELLEEGYFPLARVLEYPITDATLEKSKLKGFQYKVVPMTSGEYAEIYLKLSDVEKYIAVRNSSYHYKPSIYEEIPQEVRNLLYAGKTTIGIPFAQDGSTPCQEMTFQEAREFMNTTMENRFQEYWKWMQK